MYQKLAFIFIAVLVSAAFLGALAQPASADRAVVIRNFGCGLLDGNGGFAFTTDTHTVFTPRSTGKLTCQARVPNPSGRAVHFDFDSTGLECALFFAITTTWHETVSASGRATLTCVFNGSSA
jgi:hypothetical protein